MHDPHPIIWQGEYVFKQGDDVTHFYCLLRGEVEVVQPGSFFSENLLNTLLPGEYFGENALLEGKRARSVSIRCKTPVEVLTVRMPHAMCTQTLPAASVTHTLRRRRCRNGCQDEDTCAD